ncbi:hypothetical protein [Nonomuraea sp. NPDC049750]|uniref:hypothetical protein n=1 Tax=Nonomuraea sp. NPDC049750 TaxID=3154738 RepID=UPI0033EC0AFF
MASASVPTPTPAPTPTPMPTPIPTPALAPLPTGASGSVLGPLSAFVPVPASTISVLALGLPQLLERTTEVST